MASLTSVHQKLACEHSQLMHTATTTGNNNQQAFMTASMLLCCLSPTVQVHDGKWGTKPTGPACVMLTTKSFNKTAGEFSGNLATNDQIEGALSAGSW